MQFNLLNNHWALILVYSSGAILGNVFIAKGYFDTIPRSLDEVGTHRRRFALDRVYADHDPAGEADADLCQPDDLYRGVRRFYLRRAHPAHRGTADAAVGLWRMVSQRQSTEFTLFAAGAVLIAVPITLLFIFLQRYLVQGLTAGASKG